MTAVNTAVPAAYLVLFRDNKVLLLKRVNTSYYDGYYSFIAGHVDPGESFKQAMVREAKEEAGITIKEENLKVLHVLHRESREPTNSQRIDIFFTLDSWEGKIINAEPHKCDDLSWFDIDDLPENTIPYIKTILENINNGIIYSEQGWEKDQE